VVTNRRSDVLFEARLGFVLAAPLQARPAAAETNWRRSMDVSPCYLRLGAQTICLHKPRAGNLPAPR
jgi:hypothetical protein